MLISNCEVHWWLSDQRVRHETVCMRRISFIKQLQEIKCLQNSFGWSENNFSCKMLSSKIDRALYCSSPSWDFPLFQDNQDSTLCVQFSQVSWLKRNPKKISTQNPRRNQLHPLVSCTFWPRSQECAPRNTFLTI